MKRKYKFTPKILQTKDGDGFILSLQKETDEGKHFYSESFSSLSDAVAALNFCRLSVFECCREDSIAPLEI